jgi:hypothetical protein
VAVITALGTGVTGYLVGKKQENPLPKPPPAQTKPYEIVKYDEILWEPLIRGANKQVLAVGTFLRKFDEDRVKDLIKKIKNDETFKVTLVMMNPDSEDLIKRIEHEQWKELQRERIPQTDKEARLQKLKEETSKVQDAIREKLRWINSLISDLNKEQKERMVVKCSDVYPTIGVNIIDNDLYAYSYPFGTKAEGSAVIIFREYEDNPEIKRLAAFFRKHLDDTVKAATELENGKYKDKLSRNNVSNR